MTVRDLLIAASGYAAPSTTWMNKLSGTVAYPNNIAVGPGGDIYVVGFSDATGNSDTLLLKFNQYGVLQWQKTLVATGSQQSRAVAVTAAGNILIGSGDTGTGKIFLIAEYDSNGTLVAQRKSTTGTYVGAAFTGAALDPSGSGAHLGDIIFAGYRAVSGAGQDAAVYKAMSSKVWFKVKLTSAGTDNEMFYGVAVDQVGNIFCAGLMSVGALNSGLIVKYDGNGAVSWQRKLGSAVSLNAVGIALDSAANAYVALSGNGTAERCTVAKYSTSGSLTWQRTLTSAGSYDSAYSIAVDASSNVYVLGQSYISGAWNTIFVAKYNSSGTIQWQRKITGTSGTAEPSSIRIGPNNNMLISCLLNTNVFTVLSLPTDGSKTGTYDIATYATSSMTDAAGALTSSITTLTEGTYSDTDSTESYTDSSTSLTSTRTTI